MRPTAACLCAGFALLQTAAAAAAAAVQAQRTTMPFAHPPTMYRDKAAIGAARLRMRGQHGAQDRHHPQSNYAPLRTNMAHISGQRRRHQAVDDGFLTPDNTEQLTIQIDWSGLYENPNPTPSSETSTASERPHKNGAYPYASCFRVGDWFKWNYPADATPPCTPQFATEADRYWPGPKLPCGGSGVGTNSISPDYFVGGTDLLGNVWDTPNSDGKLCNRLFDPTAQNCWGVCLEQDVLTAEKRDWMIARLEGRVAEVEMLLYAKKLVGPLVLSETTGKYSSTYNSLGLSIAKECAKDSRLTYRLPVHDDYCDTGFDAHVLFFPTMTQWSPFTGGYGGDTASDQYGRPIVITMGWAPPANGHPGAIDEFQTGSAWNSLFAGANLGIVGPNWNETRDGTRAYDDRAIILHELIHGLGFNIQTFQNVYDQNGKPREVVTEKAYMDIDGAVDMSVWAATGPRTLQVARDYFACATLTHFPLMGENHLGESSRGSHWETRLLREELLSYGGGSKISAFTLAMLEDTGHYRADYTKAEPLSWGRRQGCDFVTHRCGLRENWWTTGEMASTDFPGGQCQRQRFTVDMQELEDAGVPGVPDMFRQKCAPTLCPGPGARECPVECNLCGSFSSVASAAGCNCLAQSGPDNGAGVLTPDHVGCANGNGSSWDSPPLGNALWCNVPQSCHSSGEAKCTEACGIAVPRGDIDAAGIKHIVPSSDNTKSVTVMLSVLGFFILCFYGTVVAFCLKPKHYKCVLYVMIGISALFITIGMAITIAAVVFLSDMDKYGAIVSSSALATMLVIGLFMFIFNVFGVVGVARAHKVGLKGALCTWSGVLAIMVLGEITVTILLVLWVSALLKAQNEANVQLYDVVVAAGAISDDDNDGGLLDSLVTEMMGFVCEAYRNCCGKDFSALGSHAASNATNSTDSVSTTSCLASHLGSAVGSIADLQEDPSSDQFCYLKTGSREKYDKQEAVCVALQHGGVFESATCQEQFCMQGADGYQDFANSFIDWIRHQIVPVALIMGLLVLLQTSQLVLALKLTYMARKHYNEVLQAHQHAHMALSNQFTYVKDKVSFQRAHSSKVHIETPFEKAKRKHAGKWDQMSPEEQAKAVAAEVRGDIDDTVLAMNAFRGTSSSNGTDSAKTDHEGNKSGSKSEGSQRAQPVSPNEPPESIAPGVGANP